MKIRSADADEIAGAGAADPAKPRRYATKPIHPGYIIQDCLNCGFPEADGGYCPECGWQEPCRYGPDHRPCGWCDKRTK